MSFAIIGLKKFLFYEKKDFFVIIITMIKNKISKYLKTVLKAIFLNKEIKIDDNFINLEAPTNANFGDYSTSIALKIAGKTTKINFLENINWFLNNLNKNNFNKIDKSLPIGKIGKTTAEILKIKENIVWLKSITFAKIKGWRNKEGFEGHPEVTKPYFWSIPYILYNPKHIIKDSTEKNRYLLIGKIEKHLSLVIEIDLVKEKNWLVTAFLTRERYLQKKEKNCLKHKKKGKPAGTAVSPILAPDLNRDGGSSFSTLQDTQLFYNKLSDQCQENILISQIKKSPMEIAEEIKKIFPKNRFIEKIEVIKPGFINFWLSKSELINQLKKIVQGKFNFPHFHFGKNKKIMVEFAQPNTHKLFHIGHFRNISTGESIVRILEAVGNKVIRANYQGDVGLHIAKCLYGIKQNPLEIKKIKTLKDKIEFIGKMYTFGTKAYEDDEKAKEEIIKINKMIYDKNPEIMPLWEETKKWSLDYFDQIYKRVYTRFDRFYLESEVTKRGLEISQELFRKGILEKSQGAIVFNGKKFGLDTRVFINSLGFPTYEGKELGLAELEFTEFGQLDKNIHVVTPEQKSFFKVTFKVEELIDPKKYKNKQYHLPYEWVKLKDGKMSSREGNIIETNWLIDNIKEKILKKFKCNNEIAETLAVASAKYSFLKNSTQTVIYFDINESINIDGNSAPYLIYTYVRCQSVLNKADELSFPQKWESKSEEIRIIKDEINLLRKLYQFPEIVLKSAKQLSPNFIATYLYELASQYNLFYQKNPILKADKNLKTLRLLITIATANTIKKGLELLGIKTVEKM